MTAVTDPALPGLGVLLGDNTLLTTMNEVAALLAVLDADPLAAPAPVPPMSKSDAMVFDQLMGTGWREGR